MSSTIEFGDCRHIMKRWAGQGIKAQMCVTSPPYYGLRKYSDHAGMMGLEQTPQEYIASMVDVFSQVRDLLADDGTLWLNIGDTYTNAHHIRGSQSRKAWLESVELKPKDLIGIPWALAFALRADGWFLRQDIIWHKPNPMPESVRDRCTKAHEYIFLLSKSERYFFDYEAIKEPAVGGINTGVGWGTTARNDPRDNRNDKPRSKRDSFKRDHSKRAIVLPGQAAGTHREDRSDSQYDTSMRNKRSVWSVATRPYQGARSATFPPDLIRPCILAGSRMGDIVIDPFMGSGTTAAVALEHGRRYLGCELNPDYGPLQEQRLAQCQPPQLDLF